MSKKTALLFLVLACIFEMAYSGTMRLTQGFTLLIPSVLNLMGMALSVFFMEKAVKVLPMSTSYSIWAAMGTIGCVLMGVFFYGESITPLRILFVAIIIACVVGLNYTDPTAKEGEEE